MRDRLEEKSQNMEKPVRRPLNGGGGGRGRKEAMTPDFKDPWAWQCIGCWGQRRVGLGRRRGRSEVLCPERGSEEQLDLEEDGQLCLGLSGPKDSGGMCASYVPTHHFSTFPSASPSSDGGEGCSFLWTNQRNTHVRSKRDALLPTTQRNLSTGRVRESSWRS